MPTPATNGSTPGSTDEQELDPTATLDLDLEADFGDDDEDEDGHDDIEGDADTIVGDDAPPDPAAPVVDPAAPVVTDPAAASAAPPAPVEGAAVEPPAAPASALTFEVGEDAYQVEGARLEKLGDMDVLVIPAAHHQQVQRAIAAGVELETIVRPQLQAMEQELADLRGRRTARERQAETLVAEFERMAGIADEVEREEAMLDFAQAFVAKWPTLTEKARADEAAAELALLKQRGHTPPPPAPDPIDTRPEALAGYLGAAYDQTIAPALADLDAEGKAAVRELVADPTIASAFFYVGDGTRGEAGYLYVDEDKLRVLAERHAKRESAGVAQRRAAATAAAAARTANQRRGVTATTARPTAPPPPSALPAPVSPKAGAQPAAFKSKAEMDAWLDGLTGEDIAAGRV